jgi:UDP-N-acetylmuramoyl-L-alanyl-D-glutamate--2,6-diaminopimelate ligase
MRFRDLAPVLTSNLVAAAGDAEVSGVSIDSRTTEPGDLFLCMPGTRVDSHNFVDEALSKGATCVLVTRRDVYDDLQDRDIPSAVVKDAVDACWRISQVVYGNPSAAMDVVGITGTNGKTTSAWILYQMFDQLGAKGAYLGTLGARAGNDIYHTELTTPFPPQVQRLLRSFRDQGVKRVAMEASSHALAQRRVDGVQFRVALFTNLTQDHLDYHSSLEEYFRAKRRLFLDLPQAAPPIAVLNVDDPFGRKLAEECSDPITYGESADAHLRLVEGEATVSHCRFVIEYKDKKQECEVGLGASFNIANCMGALGAALALGIALEDAAEALRSVRPAPGRFESVPTGNSYQVLVDYAHTPDALVKLLTAVRELQPKRILTVFGCGGDRDRTKRPLMGNAAATHSDIVYVTSDNPRTEDPEAIIRDILPGIRPGTAIRVDPDRRKAIHQAIQEAKDGDVVVIAGKGHEDYQILGTQKIHFDDREVAAEAIAARRR